MVRQSGDREKTLYNVSTNTGPKSKTGLLEDLVQSLKTRDITKDPLSKEEAVSLMGARGSDLMDLVAVSGRVRQEMLGNKVRLCGIVNARSGGCSEDCAFCAQARDSEAKIDHYGLLDEETIFAAARSAQDSGAGEFSIVTSGRAVKSKREVSIIVSAVKRIRKETKLETCASLGVLDEETLATLKDAGLQRFHHNLESSPSYYPNVCSTHSFEEKIRTAQRVKAMGLKLCSGGIFGLGESLVQRVEMLMVLAELSPDSVPINFLNPVEGTRLQAQSLLTSQEAVAVVAVARLILPGKHIILCGGREVTLRSLQPLALLAGASGLLVGDYLTTRGRPAGEDLEMIRDLGFEPYYANVEG
ncbi:MAG: biotin synthase BioB [Deltaproteobacteria bacterium]|nr:biotin synthase BioB [Deltaproteobacteria bacterium]